MTQVAIIGLGTIGGSLGMALQQAKEGKEIRQPEELRIIGYDEDAQVQRKARQRGAVDQEANTLEEAVQDAEIVIIAAEAQSVGETLQAIGPHLRPGCIVTDTASNKTQVLHWAEEFLPSEVSFVGGNIILHPDRDVDWEAGIDEAKPELLQQAIYCLVPAPSSQKTAVETMRNLVHVVGASPFFLGVEEHDGLLAGLRHVPYVLVSVMLHTIASSPSWRDLKLLADPDFRSLAMLSTSQPSGFYQTCMANRQPVLSWLDRVIAGLQAVRQEMADETSEGEYLRDVVERARAAHQDWVQHRDEREKELEPPGGYRPEGFGQMFLGLLFPRALRRRKEEEEED